VYLAFLGLVWITPVVTLDRLDLIAVWTCYLAIVSMLKDRRLARFIGPAYRDYQARGPGYPGLLTGPLARIPVSVT
jgi:protein-S-isoprenylcysteine O-methyltransferase Ste14